MLPVGRRLEPLPAPGDRSASLIKKVNWSSWSAR